MPDWARIRNTYLQAPWLFPLVIGDRQFDLVLNGYPRRFPDKIQRALERLVWFWPRVVDATVWAAGDTDRRQTPLNYTTLDAQARLLLHWIEQVCPDREEAILDLGCSCGRHIRSVSRAARYHNRVGVDAMRARDRTLRRARASLSSRTAKLITISLSVFLVTAARWPIRARRQLDGSLLSNSCILHSISSPT